MEMVHISSAPARRPADDDFEVIYSALVGEVLADAEARGRDDISLPHVSLVTAPSSAIPREALMALPDREFVENCYLLVVDRPASPRELSGRLARLAEGDLDRQELVDSLANSLEVARAHRTVRVV